MKKVWRVALASLSLSLVSPLTWAAAAIQSITSSQQAGSDVIRIDLSEPLAVVPAGFVVQAPPRIAIDLPGVTSQLKRPSVEINQGNLRTVNVVQAGDLMSRHLLLVRPQEPIGHAARLMRDWDCGALPVVDGGGRLLGMVTDRDITVRLVAQEADTRHCVVSDCMTRDAIACHVEAPIQECMRQMSHHQIRRMPVVNDRKQVIGIISQSDLARHAGNYPGHGERRALANVMCAVSAPTHVSHR